MDFVSTLKRLLKPLLPQQVLGRYHRWHRIRYIEQLNPDWDSSRRSILAINHSCDQDYRAIARANTRFNFVEVRANTLFRGSVNYFSDDIQAICAPYESAEEIGRQRYRRECQIMLDRLLNRFPFDVILTPNDNFFFVREFIDVAHKRGIPTVIMDKEGTITPHSFEEVSARVKVMAPCISDHVLVWNHRQKTFWNKMGVPLDRITVVGQPRSDLLCQDTSNQIDSLFEKKQPLVTTFTYLDTAYMLRGPDGRSHDSWVEMKRATNEETARLSREFPTFNFVIKCHPQQRDVERLRREFERDNLRVLGGSSLANELILKSELIIAFQTTAVIEAMFLDKNVIYTGWDPRLGELHQHLLPFHEAPGIVASDTFEQFQNSCRRFLRGDRVEFEFSEEERRQKEQFVSNYLFQPDGHASERLLGEIERFLS